VKGVSGAVRQKRVCVKYGGTSQKTEELSVTLGYGVADWPTVYFSLREYVSNAIDACFEAGMNVYQMKNNVEVEVVSESQVRAAGGRTRVFVPLTPEIQAFYDDIGKWFLHFSDDKLVTRAILPKSDRNTGNRKVAVIYRRGVYVREFLADDRPSIFDYNLNDLVLNESRTASDWDVKHACARALGAADQHDIAKVFAAMAEGKDRWEITFDSYGLSPGHCTPQELDTIKETWQAAFGTVMGNSGVLMSNNRSEIASAVLAKGYIPLCTPALGWIEAGEEMGIRSVSKVLSADDMDGRTLSDATPDAIAMRDWVWGLVERFDMANGKSRPEVGCYYKHMMAGTESIGLYKDGTVFVHTDIATGKPDLLRWCMVEECAHHATGAGDLSRDLQTWCFRFIAKLGQFLSAKSGEGI
jgi:hypothetical protein